MSQPKTEEPLVLPSQMNAAVFYGPNSISRKIMPVRRQAGNNIHGQHLNGTILKVDACAVCGYDVRVFRNGHNKVIPPVILGHEICGTTQETISVAPMVKGTVRKTIRAGSRVSVLPILPCLECHYCCNRQYNMCTNLRELGSTVDGGFAEYVSIPRNTLRIGAIVEVPENLDDASASLLEPLSCCLNGLSKVGPVSESDNAVIIGDGPIGLIMLQLFKRCGAEVIVAGMIPERLGMAKTLGADHTVLVSSKDSNKARNLAKSSSTAKNAEEIRTFFSRGASTVIVAASSMDAFDLGIRIAGKNSRVNVFAGMPKGHYHNGGDNSDGPQFDLNWIHYNQISLTGSFSSTPKALHEAAILASEGSVNLSKIATHRYSLDKIEEALVNTEKHRGLRTVIDRF